MVMRIYENMQIVDQLSGDINNLDKDKEILCLAHNSEADDIYAHFQINTSNLCFDKDGHTHLESHKDFDYISLNAINLNGEVKECHIEIFYNDKYLIFLYDDESCITQFINVIEAREKKDMTLDMLLFLYFNTLTGKDTVYHEAIEDQIEDLEDSIDSEKNLNDDYVKTIIEIRKNLLKFKRYYDSLLDLIEDIQGNINGYIDKDNLRLFEVQKNHTEHLYDSIISLREYITQVKEGYQTQIDISQNKIMQYLTVITAIFLPLSVIAAWYGMNFKMPEFESNYAYPVIISLSAAIVIISIVFLKKKKWF